MSKRQRPKMRQEEYGLHFSPSGDEFHSINRSGEVLNTYVRHRTPLELWRRNGLRETEYQAGQRYGALWRSVCRPRSPVHSDTTRIIVDGGGAAPDMVDLVGYRAGELADAGRAIGDEEVTTFLNRLCGAEDWPAGDKRRFKRVCMRGLKRLVEHWRRR